MAGFNRDFDERDDAQVFDASEDQESEGSSLLMAIVISLLVLAALGCVVWIAYNNGVAHGHRDIAMQSAIASAKPAAVPADNADPNAKAQAKAEDGEGSYTPPPPQSPPPAAAAPAVQPPAPREVAPKAVAVSPANPAPAPAVAPKQSAAAPAPGVNVRSVPVKTIDNPNKPPAPLQPPRPLSALAGSAPARESGSTRLQPPPAPVKPAVKADTKTAKADTPKVADKSAAKAEPAAKPAASASGSSLLQLGAYKSEEEANTAWKTFKGKHGAILAGAGPNIQKADLGEKGTWYRLRTGPFASKEAAQSVCDKLKADGGACFPAK